MDKLYGPEAEKIKKLVSKKNEEKLQRRKQKNLAASKAKQMNMAEGQNTKGGRAADERRDSDRSGESGRTPKHDKAGKKNERLTPGQRQQASRKPATREELMDIVGSDDEYDFFSNDESQYLQYLEDQERDTPPGGQPKGSVHAAVSVNSKRSQSRRTNLTGTPGGRGVQSKKQGKAAEYDDIEGQTPERGTIGLDDIMVEPKQKAHLDEKAAVGARQRLQDPRKKPSFQERSSGVGAMFGSDSEGDQDEITDSVQ